MIDSNIFTLNIISHLFFKGIGVYMLHSEFLLSAVKYSFFPISSPPLYTKNVLNHEIIFFPHYSTVLFFSTNTFIAGKFTWLTNI